MCIRDRLRVDGLADIVQGRLKDGLLAVQILIAVIFGEGDGDIEGLAGVVADDLIFKVVDVAVSYTHLDVYKRQAKDSAGWYAGVIDANGENL